MRVLTLLIFLLVTSLASGQTTVGSASVNLRDKAGKPHGMWYIRQPPRMGEPAYAEWGTYDHGRKTGVWYQTDAEGEIKAVERFRNDVKDGEAKYFQSGRLIAAGPYRGLNPAREYDTVLVTNAVTGEEKPVRVRTDRGSMRHGLWRFYDEQTGRLTREVEFQVDEVIYQRSFLLTKDDSTYYEQRIKKLPHVRRPNARDTRGVNRNLGY
jgi:hypothetical protein